MNRVTLLGHMGADAERAKRGDSVVLRVATNERYRTKDGDWKDSTTWHRVRCYGKLAEASLTLRKGVGVFVDGRLHVYSLEVDGSKRTVVEIVAQTVAVAKLPTSGEPGERTVTVEPADAPADDIPF